MIDVEILFQVAKRHRFEVFSGVPCSYLKPIINHLIDSNSGRYVPAANEGDAVAIAAGAQLGGAQSVCMFQNSGLGNAVSPLTSLTHTFKIPVLLLITHRGEPGGAADEPQHELMGQITSQALDLMKVPWERMPDEERALDEAFDRAVHSMRARSEPYALIVSQGCFGRRDLRSMPDPWAPPPMATVTGDLEPGTATRGDVLRALRAVTTRDDVLIATTGFTGRELYAIGDEPNQFYMVGSMGCASSLGLGLALVQPERRIVVIDGDGATLMRMGALSTLGHERPGGLIHIAVDNGRHESTGGQRTVTDTTDLAAVAAACGYPRVVRETRPDAIGDLVRDHHGETLFVHVRVAPGTPSDLPRPNVRPHQVSERLRAHLAAE